MLKRVKTLLAVGLAALGMASANAESGPTPSFSKDIVPILRTRCVACHMTDKGPGNLSLAPSSAYVQLLKPSSESKQRRVQAGKPEASYLVHKLRGTQARAGGNGEQMPLGAPPLERSLMDKIWKWIADGAPNN